MPSRRRYLRTAGIGLGLGLAGCLGTGGESPDGTTELPTEMTTELPTEMTTESPTETTESPTEATTRSPPTAETAQPAAVAERGVPIVPTVESTETRPFRAFVVGDRDGVTDPENNLPHQIWIWNDTDEKREISVSLAAGGATVLDETVEFPARAALGIELADPRRYELTARADDLEQTVEISRSQFDCNRSATDVVVRRDEITDATITTELACETATSES